MCAMLKSLHGIMNRGMEDTTRQFTHLGRQMLTSHEFMRNMANEVGVQISIAYQYIYKRKARGRPGRKGKTAEKATKFVTNSEEIASHIIASCASA